jgi:hypothetical protein
MDAAAVARHDDGVRLVPVFETLDAARGALIRGLLESDGIEVLAKGEGIGPYRAGPVILFVADDAAGRAKELIAASEDGALALETDDDLTAGTPAD